MAQISVFLSLTAEGEDIQGNSTVRTIADVDVSAAIECLSYEEGVQVGYDPRSGKATGDRTYDPIRITKWVDKASPLLASAATRSKPCEGRFMFFRPTEEAGGWEHFFSVALKDARVQRIRRYLPQGEQSAPAKEEVDFVFGQVTWTHETENTEHHDNWSDRSKG